MVPSDRFLMVNLEWQGTRDVQSWYQRIESLALSAGRCAESHSGKTVLAVLDLLDRVLCMVKMEPCFETRGRYDRALQAPCAKLAETGLISCSEMQDLRQVPESLFATLEAAIADCPIKDDPFWAAVHQPGGIAWSLGAHHAYKSCDDDGPDLASNLICAGWSGILLEGHEVRNAKLRAFFEDRRDVALLSQLAEARSVAAMLEDATWNNPFLRNREVDLLQITLSIDDCGILGALLKGGVRWPRFLRIIFWHPIPPPIVYRPGSQRQLGDWYEDVFELTGETCSLQAVFDEVQEHYGLWSLDLRDCDKANFVRRDVAAELGVDLVEEDALAEAWYQRYAGGACLLNSHVFDTLLVDPRLMLDEHRPISEKMELWQAHLQTIGRINGNCTTDVRISSVDITATTAMAALDESTSFWQFCDDLQAQKPFS
ncbi:hypothetical protein AK812_SmicGene18713 [Symbiodinium microadriaticum]|uniref:Uncharacterized protein n=1 Tax=Symbiodinium microadriaticum TaxID=2951 RepID=A0A1Q9DUF7_SYMMI|nr:hypothetical protein AK812_SmicGene18713 [Symbiodinium microadriaticum]